MSETYKNLMKQAKQLELEFNAALEAERVAKDTVTELQNRRRVLNAAILDEWYNKL